jgi:chromosome partitioning protein
MPRKISFINYKGGVGKTSLIVNVGAALAQAGKRVLLIDLDAQSNSSLWLMRFERWNPLLKQDTGHLYTIFTGANRLKDCVIRDVVAGNSEGKNALHGLDLVPTTFSLVDLEETGETEGEAPPYMLFQQQLAEIEDDYDFILFDCPPNVLTASRCGLFCSHEIYVPVNPDILSLIGFTLLADKLKQFQQESACHRSSSMAPPVQIEGAIFNAIKANLDVTSAKLRIQVRMNQLKGKGVVSNAVRIFKSQVRDAVIVPRSVTLGLPVCLIGAKEQGTGNTVQDDYRSVALEIIDNEASVKASRESCVASGLSPTF